MQVNVALFETKSGYKGSTTSVFKGVKKIL